jgi:small-conductance mechanosensitive channel
MISVFGFKIPLPPGFDFLDNAYGSFLATIIAWIIITLVLYIVVTYPLRWMLRRLPGEIADIILEIVRKPIVVLVIAFGASNSLVLLPLTNQASDLLDRIFKTVVTVLLVHIVWWFVKDVLVYYGNRWARQTESALDDILIPALNLFGPLLIILAGALAIFPLWGIDVSSVLVGAGVVGLVLGLALQEPLSNVFSGLSLLIESPFRPGDLIVFTGDKIGEVERLGLRSTQIYSIEDHATVYVPNKALSANLLMNINKPTVEQRYSLTITLPPTVDLTRAQEQIKQTADAHPNVVTDDLNRKITLLHERIAENEHRANALAANDLGRRRLLDEAERYKCAAYKLELENKLNQYLAEFQDALFNLLPAIRTREVGGFSGKERQDLQKQFVDPLTEKFQRIVSQAELWSQAPDPWITEREERQQRKLWWERNERLKTKWERLRDDLLHPSGKKELRLDDLTINLLDWLKKEYKILPEDWKNPTVTFKEFGEKGVIVQLWFFVDNVRLEHYGRSFRVRTELARQIREQLDEQTVRGNN